MNPLEIQPAKIHCPPARDDTLSRARLNSWLERAVSGRLGLIVAEAGFGKTTLLADWARHSTRLTTWYRLEADDRDWLTFIRHLVAGGRELDPEFASETFRLLHELGPGGPTPADLTASVAREMAAFGAASPAGLTLLLDDFHVVDGHPDTDPIVRALLDRTGPGFSVVIATRSMPRFSVGRLRARGGVMTIDGETLCFDMDETSRLFREAYRRPLDEDVVTDLHDRTEGWPALLTLVRTGLEDRESSDPRALVAHLDASRGDLYEFLAEEVMGSLSPELQHFLTRVSVLMAVDAESAMLVDDRTADEIDESIRESERLGLLTRPDRESPHRFHHLVREFLLARLRSEIGDDAVRALHRSIGDRVRGTDWYAAAWHYLMAGDRDACSSVVDGALDEIIARGTFDQVRTFLEPDAGDPERPVALILRSRAHIRHGDLEHAALLARAAVSAAVGTQYKGVALLNVISVIGLFGLDDEASSLLSEALTEQLTPSQKQVAQSSLAVRQSSDEGDLASITADLDALARAQEAAGQSRYAGITRQNRATVLLWLGDATEAYRDANRSESLLGGLENPSFERIGASALRAVSMAQLGDLEVARSILATANAEQSHLARVELAAESTRVEVEFGSLLLAERAHAEVAKFGAVAGHRGITNLMAGQIALRRGDPTMALVAAERLEREPCTDVGAKMRTHLLLARAYRALGRPDAMEPAQEVRRIAQVQQSRPGKQLGDLLVAMAGLEPLDDLIHGTLDTERYAWSFMAEDLSDHLGEISESSRSLISIEANRRPERWASALRLTVEAGGPSAEAAGAVLADIGSTDDASWLRTLSASRKWARPLSLRIAQRLASPVLVLDLGMVQVRQGDKAIARSLRRKVLALLCFLATRPGMASNRDEALDALWPELSPSAGANSLHQAIYFMRRAFDPDYREGLSASYIDFDGEVVRLNPRLVRTVSQGCWWLLREVANRPQALDELLDAYVGKFALDFVYEDWASDYRDTLHAGVLAAVESEVKRARLRGDFERTIGIAQRILSVDAGADGIELELLIAYKASGRRAAAAEQYAHYAAYVREELGVDPPSLDQL